MITRICNGSLVTSDGVQHADLWIDGEVIACLGASTLVADRTIDATGCLVFPGSIDPHVHMGFTVGEFTSTDSFETGTRAAALGGVTTILDFAVPEGEESISEAAKRRMDQARGRSSVDFGIHAVVPRVDEDLRAQIEQCIMFGVPDFKTFTTYTGLRLSDSALLSVMGCVQEVGGLIMVHAEDDATIQRETAALVQRERVAAKSHPLSRPAEAESLAVRRILELQETIGCCLHFVHISAADSLMHIEAAKSRGADISAETCPQYLFLTDDAYRDARAPLMMLSPPLRSEASRVALWKGICDGVIDMIATDHCPFSVAQKTKYSDFRKIPTGLPGVETTLGLLFTMWDDKGWPFERLADVLSTNVAKRYGLYPKKGALVAGADADVTVYSPDGVRTISAERLHMNVDWSPFEGLRVKGSVRDVLLRGNVLVENGIWMGESNAGQFLPRAHAGAMEARR